MQLINSGTYVEMEKGLVITANAKTDFFIDTMNNIEKNNAPFVYKELSGDFVVSACVEPELHTNYDAGGIFIMENERRWAKFELEQTDLAYPSIVSVITNEVSDVCNGEKMEAIKRVYLQVIRRKDYWVFHHSVNGINWKMNRYFRFKMKETIKVGFEVQSPAGNGTKAVFTDICIGRKEIKNLRSGT